MALLEGSEHPEQPVERPERANQARHTEQAEQTEAEQGGGDGASVLERLRADVARLSVRLMSSEPLGEFLEMRRVRDRMHRLLDAYLRPADQGDLYFLVGCVSELMAAAAADLGYPQAAEDLIRAGWAYASAIEHRPLLGHLRLQFANVALCDGRPKQALDLAEDGVRYLSAGPNAARLLLIRARAAARLGDTAAARRSVAQAHEARTREATARGPVDELLTLGGEFHLTVAAQHCLGGSALAELARPGLTRTRAEATAEVERALRLYEAGAPPGEHFGYGTRALASIDLATLRLKEGDTEAAAAAIAPALALPPAQRIVMVTERMRKVRAELATPGFRESAQARELDEMIEDFSRDSVTSGLRGFPVG